MGFRSAAKSAATLMPTHFRCHQALLSADVQNQGKPIKPGCLTDSRSEPNICWWQMAAKCAHCYCLTARGWSRADMKAAGTPVRGAAVTAVPRWGHYHHPGCNVERRPVCGGQVLSRPCLEGANMFVGEPMNEDKTASAGPRKRWTSPLARACGSAGGAVR